MYILNKLFNMLSTMSSAISSFFSDNLGSVLSVKLEMRI